ncbi:MAG TPA: DUF3540 domain-containing protein [Acetobacteraceae bacterium]|nr:DUF3540 domain-containing protein [Acetobacteraceae bacterium]
MTAVPVGAVRGARAETMSRVGDTCDVATDVATWHADAASAVVVALDGRDAFVTRNGIEHAARIAIGCLIRPEPGDRVLTSTADGVIWITAVLDRHSDMPLRLWAEANLEIVSARGDVSLTAAGAVDIGAGSRARVAAPEINLHAGVARFVLDELTQVGRRINCYVTTMRSIGEVIETFAEHVLTRAKRSSRFIEASDQMRAGDIDHRAEGTLQLQAEVALVTADTVVRMDAAQIHMG